MSSIFKTWKNDKYGNKSKKASILIIEMTGSLLSFKKKDQYVICYSDEYKTNDKQTDI